MLPYTGEQQAALTTRLDEALTQLREATPAWWQANRAQLIAVADVDAELRGLGGDEADRVEAAAEAFEDVVTRVATAANETGARLFRLRAMARQYTGGISHRPLMRELNALTIVMDWPSLQVDTEAGAAEMAAAVAEMAAAAAERAELPPSAVQRAEDAVRNTFATAIQEWQPRRTAALRLAERVRELLPEAGERRDELGVARVREFRALSAVQLPGELNTLEQLEAAGRLLATVTARTELLEAAIGAVLTVTIDTPIREIETAVAGLSAEVLRLLPYAGDQQATLEDQLRHAKAALAMPSELAHQPARQESVIEASSALETLKRFRQDAIPEFIAAVAAVLQAVWLPPEAEATRLAGQARALLRIVRDYLPNGRGEALTRELGSAERNLVGNRRDLPARALLQRIPGEHAAPGAAPSALPAAAEDQPGPMPQIGQRQVEREAAVAAALGDLPPGRPATVEQASESGQRDSAVVIPVTQPETATPQVLAPATGGPRPDSAGPRPDSAGPRPDSAGPRPDSVGILAEAARELLPRTGRKRTQLTTRLGAAAVGDLHQVVTDILRAANEVAQGQVLEITDLARIARDDLLPFT